MRPRTVRLTGLPDHVTVYEVGPRDGLQNEPAVVPLETKLELIARLVGAGLKVVEVTSLVRPDRVPQLADAEELLARLPQTPGVRFPVLVPNRSRSRARPGQRCTRDRRFRQCHGVLRPAQPQPQPGRSLKVQRGRRPCPPRGAGGPRLCLDVFR